WVRLLEEQKALREIRKRAFDEVTVARRATEEAITALAQPFPEIDRAGIEARYQGLMSLTPARSTTGLPPGLLQDWQSLRETAEGAFYEAGNGGLGVRHKETNNESSSEACTKGFPKKAGAVLPKER